MMPRKSTSLPSAATLVDVLTTQRTLVAAMRELSQRQADIIRSGDTEALLELLSDRQTLTDAFVKSQQRLPDLTSQLDRDDAFPAGDRDRIRSLVDEISQLIAEVVSTDDQDQALLRNARGRKGEQLAALGNAKRVRNAYQQADRVDNRFADEQG